MVNTSVRIPKGLHRRLKLAAIERDQRVCEIMAAALRKHLP
jgi:predicted HicB family RNase H-like nuclease